MKQTKIAVIASLAFSLSVSSLSSAAPAPVADDAPVLVKPLADRYVCDGGKILLVNDRVATWRGKRWNMANIYPDTSFKADGRAYQTTQYEFARGSETITFVTGQGKPQQGALLLPASDSWLFCKAK